jgi:hypothetical protein
MNDTSDLLETEKKERRKFRLMESRAKGKYGEDVAKTAYGLAGYKVEKTGRGSDFKATKTNPITGRMIDERIVEVKTGETARESKLQKETRKRLKDKHNLVRFVHP